jgi:DNA replication ATP-dependent helicase Dna2
MPTVSKEALSSHIRSGCDRQLRLTIATGTERTAQGMPGKQPPRPGLEDAAQEGIKWQHEKITDLRNTFGTGPVLCSPKHTQRGAEYDPIDLDINLTAAAGVVPATLPGAWLVEAQFPIGITFENALGIAGHRATLGIGYADLRPDLIEVRPPEPSDEEVLPSGVLRRLDPADTRLRLRVIDVKLTAEPSPGYFAEVTFYSMALAGWLHDHARSHEFLVVSDGALWPGSHDASALATSVAEIRAKQNRAATQQEMSDALKEDLEAVPFAVFVPEVRRFFKSAVPHVLAKAWTDLEYHVDNRCRTCPFLGAPWIDRNGNPTAEPGHCLPTAGVQAHLSQVAYVSRGARTALERSGVKDVRTLAGRQPSDPAFSDHHVLRGSRTVLAERAVVLTSQGAARLAPNSGTSALMPKWADLIINISVDFDASSAITFAFGVQAFWLEPRPFGAPRSIRAHHSWPAMVFPVDRRSTVDEQRELLRFLHRLQDILTTARRLNADTKFQVYIWDQLQMKHLARVIGRHLPAVLADNNVRELAWLFPDDRLVADPGAIARRSPITVLRDIVRATVAAPVGHYYSLLGLARTYHPAALPANVAKFSVHPLFEDPLSDQIPSERAHEIWSRSSHPTRGWSAQLNLLNETVRKRLRALDEVRKRLHEDLKGSLTSQAPKMRASGMGLQLQGGMAVMSELWFAHAKLDAAFGELEVAQLRAMPPHERESKFKSAILTRRLHSPQRAGAIAKLAGVTVLPSDFVYELVDTSRELRARAGDIGFALAPRSQPGLLDQRLNALTDGTVLSNLVPNAFQDNPELANVLGVSIVAIDREALVLVVRPSDYWPTRLNVPDLLDQLEQHTALDLDVDVLLDPVHTDFFTYRLATTLKAIGNPQVAIHAATADLKLALGDVRKSGPRKSRDVPAGDLLWDAQNMHAARVHRNLGPVVKRLQQAGHKLNPSQQHAWQQALSRRLQPIWGPPGTGKSHTMRTIALGAAIDAEERGEGIRILTGAANYGAFDNVLDYAAARAAARSEAGDRLGDRAYPLRLS